MHLLLVLTILLGHVFLWIGVINRLHSVHLPRKLIRRLTLTCFALIGLGPIAAAYWWLADGRNILEHLDRQNILHPGWLIFYLYAAFCLLITSITLVRWISFRLLREVPQVLRSHRQSRVIISPTAAAITAKEHEHHVSVRLPGNEALRLDLTERAFDLPRLPVVLDGLTIVHLSDFHFTGLVGKSYFREVVRISNELQPDLVAITGDLVDMAECIDWVPEILGKLTARYGVYVILGNHDLRVNEYKLRRTLVDSGLIDVGRRWISLNIRDENIIIAGNELPWFKPAADLKNCPPRGPGESQLRIVLSHSPDQLKWARENKVDLMLSGHTHGGQIRIPIIGAILTPSLSGVKYDCGLFHEPPTILHITRGISGKQPLRWNCPPEIALLTLHAPQNK
jgi:uncharacterized protein